MVTLLTLIFTDNNPREYETRSAIILDVLIQFTLIAAVITLISK